MTPRAQHQIQLKLVAMALLSQLPPDPVEAKAVLKYLNELVEWVGKVDEWPATRAIAQ